MTRLLGVLVTALLAWCGVMQPVQASVSTPVAAVATYAYDACDRAAVPTCTTTERGPPAEPYRDIANPVDGHWPDGFLARSARTATSIAHIYDALAPLAQAARDAGTTYRQVQDERAALSALGESRVAAKSESALVKAGEACLNSFTGTTLVLMADGTKKPIKDVKLGDEVMATDPVTGKTGPRKVVDLIRHSGLHTMVAVRLSDGTTIDATDRHPFWVESRGEWVDAIDLQPGDVVVTADGDQLAVAGVGISERDLTAYNLTVAELHTYYAGTDAVLVHNSGCDPFDAARALRGADPEDVLNAIPDNWIVSDAPKAVGGGMKFSNPANRSQIIIFERGSGLAPDGVHGGPYLRLSSGRGGVERIPLLENPILGGP